MCGGVSVEVEVWVGVGVGRVCDRMMGPLPAAHPRNFSPDTRCLRVSLLKVFPPLLDWVALVDETPLTLHTSLKL